jgi:hypothetical protein
MNIFKSGKKSICGISFLFVSILIISCNKYAFVETKNNQSVYLDQEKGKVVYVDETNRVVDSVNLNLTQQDIQNIEEEKTQIFEAKFLGTKDVGTRTTYNLSLSMRFYNNRLLYLVDIKPYNSGTRRMANTINVHLADINGFVLEELDLRGWTTAVENEEEIGLSTFGSIPISINNYMEINDWNPLWSD